MTDHPLEHLFNYHIEPLRAIDGDTIEVRIDLGLKITVVDVVRLLGVDTPEVHGEQKARGLQAKLFTITWLETGTNFWLKSYQFHQYEKYGRILGDIWKDNDTVPLSEALKAAGHVK